MIKRKQSNYFFEQCDYCKTPIIDHLRNYNKYTVTKTINNETKINVYCQDCIKQFKIKTDE